MGAGDPPHPPPRPAPPRAREPGESSASGGAAVSDERPIAEDADALIAWRRSILDVLPPIDEEAEMMVARLMAANTKQTASRRLERKPK